ncbi:hypothetical protein PN36_01465 [Candidatus Thiomargarita nelsonii]|uniref:BrnT family toxin n=1 Tax=Candidatus Thiomargarita nelsonii TaxID=1003181 RepID=A0A0A6RNK3_9GAMM|nr:hypothetical protein PN36_01465 [Candidatus Thiomargarita nelsonii]
MKYEWDEEKRRINLFKHGLDFIVADRVLVNPYRLDIESQRNEEVRIQSFAYVFDVLSVLTVVHRQSKQSSRIISFRRASRDEREVYHEWLENDYKDTR